MASDPVKYMGKIDCPVCGEDLHVRQNGRDTLNISCICCGVSSYAKGGTPAHGMIMGWLNKGAPAPAAAAPVPAHPQPIPTPAPAPAAQNIAKAIKSGFSMGAL